MTFSSIPQGSRVFIDANTLVYYFTADPQYGTACRQFVERIARQEIQGLTSAHVLGDVAHRVMTLEAMAQFGWPARGIAPRLRKHPGDVRQLTRFRQAVEEVTQVGIRVLPVDGPLISTAAVLSQQYGLLTGDALVVATMHLHQMTDVASLDDDFDRVPGITRYAPQ